MTGRRPDLVITLDRARGCALVRGPAAEEALFLTVPHRFQWSGAGRGWVAPISAADDMSALASVRRWLVVIHERKAPR